MPQLWPAADRISDCLASQPHATDPATVAEAQLQINKTTLLESKTAATRISTASFLLSSDNPAAREILLEILRRTDNPEARAAGGAAGKLKGGRHLKYPENTPMSNLLVTLLDKAGVPVDKFGDSTGRLQPDPLTVA